MMARWIPLSLFHDLFESESDLLSQSAHTEFIDRLGSAQATEICERNQIRLHDFHVFKESIRSPEAILFHSWVAQDSELKETLNTEKVSGTFKDKKGVLKHTLADTFRRFISPYLTPILLQNIPDDVEKLSVYFSYATLLEKDSRAAVEGQLFKNIRTQLALLKQTEYLHQEQELIGLVKPLCSDAFIVSINSMSKSSYALKMEYVDAILSTIQTPACTVRFANWILKQMDQLTLNHEHNEKILQLRKELAEGKLRVKKYETTVAPARPRVILTYVFIAVLLLFGVFVILFKPFSDPEVYNAYESAEKSDFSDEELREIDSLVATIDYQAFLEGEEIDPGIIISRGQSITIRRPYETPLMEQIFSDINKDVTLKENYYVDSCGSEVNFQRYPGVQDLSKKSGAKTVLFRNESAYDIVIYVSDNKAIGSVYSMYVKEGSSAEFQMNVDDVLTTSAGKTFAPFYHAKGSMQEEKPSKSFKFHFCETDNNYFESINTSLRLLSTSKTTIKFMTTGKRGQEFQLLDIYDVAESY